MQGDEGKQPQPEAKDELPTGTNAVAMLKSRVNQIAALLEDTQNKLDKETAAKEHVQEKLEETIDKQLQLTEQLITTQAALGEQQEENENLIDDLESTKKELDGIVQTKTNHNDEVAELTTALSSASLQLDELMTLALQQRADVESSFAVRERMLQAIAKQEKDMIEAATQQKVGLIAQAVKNNISAVLANKEKQ